LSEACLIANPAAGRGRGARLLPVVREALAAVGITEVLESRGPGDERDLAAEAALRGIGTIIALGGDGTWGNVARGILASGRDVRFVPIEAGTGNDFPHALGLPARDPVAMARIAAGPADVRVDMGIVNDIPFLNVAGAGLATTVLEATTRIHRLSGHLVYVAAALPVLRSYRPIRVSLQFDEEPPDESRAWLAIVVSNGPRYGGGFMVAPGASARDGLLNALAVRDASLLRRGVLFARIRVGRHGDEPEVEQRLVRRLRLQFDQVPIFDADGELHRATEPVIDIRVLPGALRVGVEDRDQDRGRRSGSDTEP
jgi:YegS/Rv2252/BmrU family lipid kinase